MNLTNILGTITSILAVLTGIMASVFGCTATGDTITAVCTSTALGPKYMLWITMAFGTAAFVSKLLRPGGPLRSLFGSTAVVVPAASQHAGPGTVTPGQVAQP